MATHRKSGSYGHGRSLKNSECTAHHFVHFVDCCKASLDNDQQGELPLLSESFAYRYPSTANSSYSTGQFARLFVECHQSFESETMNRFPVKYKRSKRPRAMRTSQVGEQSSRTQQIRSERRRRERQQYPGTGTLRMSAAKYALHPKRAQLLAKSDEQDVRARRALHVDNIEQTRTVYRTRFEDPSITSDSNFNNHSSTLKDDECSLQHWMNFGCIQDDRSKSGHWDSKLRTKTRRLRNAENRRRSRTLMPCSRDNFELTNRARRKSSLKTQCSNCKEESCQVLLPSIPNSQNGSLTSLSSSTCQRIQRSLQNANHFPLHDRLCVSEFSGSRCNTLRQRPVRKNQRKNLSDKKSNSFTCGLSEFSRKKGGPRANVHKIPEGDSSKCTQKLWNVEEIGAKALQSKGWTNSEENKTMCAEGIQRHAKDSNRGKSAFIARLATRRGSRKIQSKVQEQDGLAKNLQGGDDIIASVKRTQSLSQKYRPKVLKDLIGQNLVAHALSSAIANGKVAPVYLFQGPSGTGKTSAARIFAAALNCLTSGGKKPCGLCSECTAFMSGKASGFWELDAASHNGTVHIKELIQGELSSATGPRYKIIVLDECHMFSQETWTSLLKLLEELRGNVVVILITTHPDKLPPMVVSRCQKFHFLRIKNSDIVDRLDTVMKLEELDAEPGALNLIASKSHGSLRDAEIVLDQLSLLEQRITLDTIHKLVGSVADEKLLSLLDMALHSDTLSTVQRTRDLVDSGVEPLDLMVQLSTLITNILAGSCIPVKTNQDKGCLSMHALSDLEMERLQTALGILLGAENQLKATSQYRTTWLTAALLHIGLCSQSKSQGSASSKPLMARSAMQSILKTRKVGKKRVPEVKRGGKQRSVLMGQASEEGRLGFDAAGRNDSTQLGQHSADCSCLQGNPTLLAQFPSLNEGIDLHVKSPSNMERLWLNMLKCCTPLSLRQLLQDHGKLLAVSFSAVKVVAHLRIEKEDPKLKAGFYNTCIVNSFKKVLGRPVEIEISMMPPALCSAGSTHAPAASWDKSVRQSTSKPCEGCKVVELQNGSSNSDVKSIQSQRCESDTRFNSACFSPAVFVPHVTSLIQPELTSLSSNTLLLVKKRLDGNEAIRPEQQRPKCDITYDTNCPLQTAVDCCLQNYRLARTLQIEALKERRRARKPTNDIHRQKYSGDGSLASLKHGNSTEVYSHGKKNLVIEPQWKCGGLLCWKSQN